MSATPPALLVLHIFLIGPCIYLLASLGYDPIFASSIAEITGMYYHAQLLLIERGTCELFAWAGIKPRASQSPPLNS
jgi:hypothetical protein